MITLDGHGEREKFLLVGSSVRFREINSFYLDMFAVVARVFHAHGEIPVITGACCETPYVKGGVHDLNHALDVRSSNIDNPLEIREELEEGLKAIDSRYRVLYHDTGLGFHFHLDWKPSTIYPF